MPHILGSVDDEVIKVYFFYCGLLVLKLLAMSSLTAYQRFKHKTFANPEDVKTLKLKVSVNENVERVRRAHMNDLENILPFLVISYIFMSLNPKLSCALMLFRAFTIARFAHTFVYAVYVVPQPARALTWFVGYLVTGYMTLKIVLHYM